MRMSEPQEHTPTVQQLAAEVARLRERVEDLEDSNELDGHSPQWRQASHPLGSSQERPRPLVGSRLRYYRPAVRAT